MKLEGVILSFACTSAVENVCGADRGRRGGALSLRAHGVFQQYIDLEGLPLISGNTSQTE